MRAVDGVWHVLGRTLHWRLGRCPGGRGGASATAYRWVEEVVTARALFEWAGYAPQDGGKPRFAATPDADFSVAHSGDVVLVAVGTGVQVGADVEAAPFAAFDSPALTRRMCTGAETAALRAVPAPDRADAAASLWTAKEAFVKALGEGLRRDVRTVPVGLSAVDLRPAGVARAIGHLAAQVGDVVHLARLAVERGEVRLEPRPVPVRASLPASDALLGSPA
ncbi:4'-phosphopantetheinyl transferase family protein [Microbacterium caowuchunii]|uniref:4'-phosphopantetheinyl transferase superfamily protein n=1 Tax=Microbacterium caowuchunii TaxID=2614638 RepID=A0A5N0TD92_9MICO|nr:4'-phosphopantetheinyl transferase superfamily protein [Microbacterium caowuchunii]KAA9132920.1 4'-phosphopantetheinyl transferase superfamily protein [Microbacterium caowuchunii]